MDRSVVSVAGHACRRIAWVAIGSFEGCDFRDNKIGRDFYNIELNEIQPSMRLI
jgi:hypothetical protein